MAPRVSSISAESSAIWIGARSIADDVLHLSLQCLHLTIGRQAFAGHESESIGSGVLLRLLERYRPECRCGGRRQTLIFSRRRLPSSDAGVEHIVIGAEFGIVLWRR